MFIKGETIILYSREQTGTDDFNCPIYSNTAVQVKNVLIAPVSEAEQVDTSNLTGALEIYQLGIPKTDTHNWEDVIVEFWGKKWKSIGIPQKGIDDLVPTEWNTKVRVEKYE